MKIALAHKRLDRRGGTEVIFLKTAQGLRDLGHEVHLFCGQFDIEPPEGTFAHKVPYLRLGRTARLLSFGLLAPRVIRRHHCDLVMSFGRMVSQDVVRSGGGSHKVFLQKMGASHGFPQKLSYRTSPYHRLVLALERAQFRNGNFKKAIAISEVVKSELLHACGVPPEKIAVLYNGVDLERFHPRNRHLWLGQVRRRLGVPHDRPLVVFIGSGFRRKGVDLLLEAWSLPLLREVCLVVVGTDHRMDHYHRAIKSRGIAERVLLTGVDPQVEKYYASADLLVLPAIQEAFGNVALEALASGLPVLVPQGSGASEILVGDLREGVLPNAAGPQEIAARVLTLLEHNRQSHLSRTAREVAEGYSWERNILRFEKVLGEVAATSSALNERLTMPRTRSREVRPQ